jgi:hypothetical protein
MIDFSTMLVDVGAQVVIIVTASLAVTVALAMLYLHRRGVAVILSLLKGKSISFYSAFKQEIVQRNKDRVFSDRFKREIIKDEYNEWKKLRMADPGFKDWKDSLFSLSLFGGDEENRWDKKNRWDL